MKPPYLNDTGLALLLWLIPFCCCKYSVIDLTSGELQSLQLNERDRADIAAAKITNEYLKTHSAPISNLQDILTPLNDDHCLVFMTSFKRVDILRVTSPTIRRTLELVGVVVKSWKGIVWSPYNGFANGSLHTSSFSTKFYDSLQISEDGDAPGHYSTILVPTFASFTKPWQCEIQISLFLPDFKLNMRKQVSYPIPIEYYNGVPLVPQVNIFIDHSPQFTNEYYENVCFNFVLRRNSYATLLKGVFLQVSLSQENIVEDILTLTTVHTYDDCFKSSNIDTLDWKRSRFEFPTNDLKQHWYIDPHALSYKYSFESALMECSSLSMMHRVLKVHGNTDVDKAKHRLIPQAQAYIFQIVMGNFSYDVVGNSICKGDQGNVAIESDSREPTGYVNYIFARNQFGNSLSTNTILYFNNTSSSLRFITCRSRGSSELSFEELVNIFDRYVWATSAILLSLTSIIISKLVYLEKSISVVKPLLSVVKCLLDQGDPFSFPRKFQTKVKVILVGVYLVAMLLSNAYKNNNVYNMVLGRKRIVYSTLEELENDNFTVYSRISGILHYIYIPFENDSFYTLEPGTKLPDFQFVKESERKTSHYYMADNRTEITVQAEVSQLENERRRRNETHDWLRRLYKIATVPEKSFELILSNFRAVTDFPSRIYLSNFSQVLYDLEQRYHSDEVNIIKVELLSNKSIAVLLPTNIAVRLKRHLNLLGYVADIGKEAFTSGVSAISFGPTVSIPFIKRLWGMQESGIINWWHHFLDPLHSENVQVGGPAPLPITAAKISGNIVIVFVVWSGGLIIATIISMLEFGIVHGLETRSTISLYLALHLSTLMRVVQKAFRDVVVCNLAK